ncbi:MAG: hypothetical protein II149_00925 [Clostridia bacterium]|nr:hypothetical protein [Clostridia bacterium]
MKKLAKLLLLAMIFTLIATACQAVETEEYFDQDLDNPGGTKMDLGGFEMIYEFGSNESEGLITENVLGFRPDTQFADLAKARIKEVENDYNCKIKINYNSTQRCHTFISLSYAGVFMCDVISGISDMWADAARAGMLVGLSELEDYIDYKDEEKWGNRSILEVVYYENDLFGLIPMGWPELNHSSFGYPLAVNEDIVSLLGQPDPREFVEAGDWTWSRFRECLANYTEVEGTETKHYGLSAHWPYYTEMFIRSNGDSLVYKDENGNYSFGFRTPTAFKAMEEAKAIWTTDLSYTISSQMNDSVEQTVDDFVNERSVMCVAPTGYLYGQDARISLNVDNFGILTWPLGPDAQPGHVYGIMENNNYCIAFSSLSSQTESSAVIINALYEPLPGFETAEDIKSYMEHNFFFDERDCNNFLAMYYNQEYNYFHYDMRTQYVSFLERSNRTVTEYVESVRDVADRIFNEDVMPSVRGIEAVWGTYGEE